MDMQKISSLILQALTFLGVLFAVYQYFRKPDEDAEKEIALLKQGCVMKHTDLDKQVGEINSTINLIKVNHLHHIEADVRELKENQVKIFTILEERLPRKNN